MLPLSRILPPAATILLCLCSAPFGARGQGVPQTWQPQFQDYGPYSAKFLLGGRGLEKPMEKTDTLLDAPSSWTMSVLFHLATATPASPTTLIAGFGDPDAEDSRYLGLEDGKPLLRLGVDDEVVASNPIKSNEWHLLAASFDGLHAHLYLDGTEVANGTPTMGPVQDPQILLGPDFITDKVARYAKYQMHPEFTVPELLRKWHHFGGTVANFFIWHKVLKPDELKTAASERPDLDTILYEDGSKPWPFQVRQQVGYVAPQPPDTLPVDHAPFGKPVSKPLPLAGPTLEQTAPNEWTLARNWKMEPAPEVEQTAEQISSPAAEDHKWYAATMPGTALTTLVDRGVYPDPDWDMNNLAIPESLNKQDYWYRVTFPTPGTLGNGHRYTLDLNGINYQAHVWLNGNEIGTITGAFIRGIYDVTALLKDHDDNVLAVRVSPPPHPGIPWEESIKAGPGDNGGSMLLDGPTFVATEGWDWIPSLRDRDTGIWQNVTLRETGEVKIGDPQIITTLPLPSIESCDVTINVPVVNESSSPENVTLHASFEGGVSVSKQTTVSPGESTISLTPREYPQLRVEQPRLWWPNGYGKPDLYHLKLSLDGAQGAGISGDEKTIQFGMREVTYEESLYDTDGTLRRVEVNPTVAHALGQTVVNVATDGLLQTTAYWAASLTPEADHSRAVIPVTNEPGMIDLVIKVNGVRIAARGGNWGMDDMMKRISPEHLEPYFRLHQLANLDIIRNWQGQNTEPVFYDLADKYGLMVWNDFFEATENWNAEAQSPELFTRNAADAVLRYRNHPSIVMWCARNEGVPQPALNTALIAMLAEEDGTRYYTPSSNQLNLRDSGPYHYMDPKLYFNFFDQGFAVELGVPSFSTLESFQHWIAPQNQWPLSDAWTYHDWHESGGGDVHTYLPHLQMQFGAAASLPEFERHVQMFNYSLHQAIFEGFNAHLWAPNSGRLTWMTQPAWPSNMWQMYSHDYDTQASFYGVMHASEPQHVQLDLSNYMVAVVNTTREPIQGAHVQASIYSLGSQQLFSKATPVSVPMDQMVNVFELPLEKMFSQPGWHDPVFVELKLLDDGGKVVSRNFYWLAAQEQDMRKINTLPQAVIGSRINVADDGDEKVATVALTNKGERAAIELKLTLEEAKGGLRILPAYYSDNYISLLPGESETVTIHYPTSAAKGSPALGLRGYNLQQTVLAVDH